MRRWLQLGESQIADENQKADESDRDEIDSDRAFVDAPPELPTILWRPTRHSDRKNLIRPIRR